MRYKIDGVERNLDENTLSNREVMDIEARCNCTYGDWVDLLRRNSMLAITALVWIGLRREQPDLKFSDVTFTMGEVFDIAQDDQEETPDAVPPTFETAEPTPNGSQPDLEENPVVSPI